MDFGLVNKEFKKSLISDKPWYPPEQTEKWARNSKAADVYSLGILFEDILRRVSFLKSENTDLRLLVLSMTQISEFRPSVGDILRKLLLIIPRVERREKGENCWTSL